MPFETLVEVISFFNILTLVKLTETCRKFVKGVKYHPSAQNPHQMRSLWLDRYQWGDRNVENDGHSYTRVSNTNQINQLLTSTSPNFLTGLCQKIYIGDVADMSSEYFQVNFKF